MYVLRESPWSQISLGEWPLKYRWLYCYFSHTLSYEKCAWGRTWLVDDSEVSIFLTHWATKNTHGVKSYWRCNFPHTLSYKTCAWGRTWLVDASRTPVNITTRIDVCPISSRWRERQMDIGPTAIRAAMFTGTVLALTHQAANAVRLLVYVYVCNW